MICCLPKTTNMKEIKAEKNLKDKLYYSDLYDRHTVERCRDLTRLFLKPVKNPPLINGKKPTQEMMNIMSKMLLDFRLLSEKGERWVNKEKRIQEWMDRDQVKDELYESAEPMDNVTCLTCQSVMRAAHKHLYSSGIDAPDKVLFMYECPRGHLPMRAFFHDGKEWIPKRDRCPKCTAELKVDLKNTKTKFISTFTCPKCDYRKVDEMKRLSTEREKEDKDFEKDRERFCLTEEQGKKYIDEKFNLERIGKLVERWKAEEKDKDLYDAVAKIKKLTFIQLKNLLSPVLEKAQYINLEFGNPDIGKDVQFVFTVNDSNDTRQGFASEADLKKLIKKTLEDTNWRLMSDGVNYKLGILTGRLRGFEKEEDLLELVKRQEKKSGT